MTLTPQQLANDLRRELSASNPDNTIFTIRSYLNDLATNLENMSGIARVLGPFSFAFDTPDIANGYPIYTPAIGDILVDAWIQINVAFNGTTPKADIVSASPDWLSGFFAFNNVLVPLDNADGTWNGVSPSNALSVVGLTGIDIINIANSVRLLPAVFYSDDPLTIVVSQNGTKGGDPVGGTAGSGDVYLIVATPNLT